MLYTDNQSQIQTTSVVSCPNANFTETTEAKLLLELPKKTPSFKTVLASVFLKVLQLFKKTIRIYTDSHNNLFVPEISACTDDPFESVDRQFRYQKTPMLLFSNLYSSKKNSYLSSFHCFYIVSIWKTILLQGIDQKDQMIILFCCIELLQLFLHCYVLLLIH